ncbi:Protein of unknown function [Soonwooa buanensis]|uniref:DUF3781 domain-containing protein n=1 Tax=Soonwooa buanensis TaxID=619805 RepID=A0A1T5GQY4_9FLAO|nr:DUF3781 domain-containing protein [Soonwooa buanensis]SKC10845.1 Protein of unknown function [Soonwooa buanensis]
MKIKSEILSKICYTDLVYGRVNKKLKTTYSNSEIENLISNIIIETDENAFEKKGKNYYLSNFKYKIKITINSYTFRLITVDKLEA